MTPKQLFNEIVKDPSLRNKLDLSKEEVDDLNLNSPSNKDHIAVLRTILYGLDNKTPDQSIYKSIRKHFGIN